MKAKKYIEVDSVQKGKVVIPVHQVQFIMNDERLFIRQKIAERILELS